MKKLLLFSILSISVFSLNAMDKKSLGDTDSDGDVFYSCEQPFESVSNNDESVPTKKEKKQETKNELVTKVCFNDKGQKFLRLISGDRSLEYEPCGNFVELKKSKEPVLQNAIEHAPEKIKEMISLLKNTKNYTTQHAKRVLLLGDSGTGKTTLAEAIAYATGRKYYDISSPSLLDHWEDCHENIYYELKPLIQKKEPLIINFDEIGCLTNKEDPEKNIVEHTLAQILDKCAVSAPHLVFVGTSMHNKNFSRVVNDVFDIYELQKPSESALTKAIQINLGKRNSLSEQELATISKKFVGRHYFDVDNIIRSSYCIARRRNKEDKKEVGVTLQDIEQAMQKHSSKHVSSSTREIAHEFVTRQWTSEQERAVFIADNLKALEKEKEYIDNYFKIQDELARFRNAFLKQMASLSNLKFDSE